MKINQLPSGNYNTRIRVDGKSYSFTAPTKNEVKQLANEFRYAKNRRVRTGPTVAEAVKAYIDSKRSILSPSTIYGYDMYAEVMFPSIMQLPIGKLTNLDVQNAVNEECQAVSMHGKPVTAKTICNRFGLLSASLRAADPNIQLNITLPKKPKQFRDLPTPAEVIHAVKGTDIELPVLLAMWLSLSVSEIRGIKVFSIRQGVLYIEETVVTVAHQHIHKELTKAYDRTRKLLIPEYIMRLIEQTDAWKAGEGYLVTRSREMLFERFQRVLDKAGVKPCRFHDLRHLFASVGLQLNVPEKYLMEMGGWSTPNVMKSVYQHTFTDEMIKVSTEVNSYYENLINAEN